MAPLTAVLLLLVSGASSQFTRHRALSDVLLVAAFALATAVLAVYFGALHFDFTRLFHRHTTPIPELPAPDAAASFLLLAIAFFCLRSRSTHAHDFADVVAATIGVVCLQVLIAYAYDLAFTADAFGFRQIAPHSTIAVMLISLTLVAQRPTWGIYAAMAGEAQSALLLRRLLPISVVCCLIVGLLEVEAIRVGLGGTIPEIAAWAVSGAIVVLALLLFVTSAGMRQSEETVRNREQELLSAKQAAEAASNTKSRFIAVMSHELRTPLTAMLGYADLLDAGVTGELTPEARVFVDRIRSSGWHLVGLIDAVLLYASGRLASDQIRNEKFDVVQLLRDSANAFDAQARDKKISLRIDSSASPLFVLSDRHRLREVLVNIVSNAVKFTERGSVVLRADVAGDKVTVAVTDTGIGIGADYVEKLFEPFEQVEDPHTREHGGMGLGLALTRMVCEQMGIPIRVQSTIGKGTAITLDVPLAPRAQQPERQPGNGVRVLVVDDEMTVRRIMARALARHNVVVTEARDAQDALDKIGSDGGFDVVVTDISMPGMSGIELARALTAKAPALPVLFVTGAELNDEDRHDVNELGGQLLTKPFDMSEFARTVVSLARS